MKVIHLISGGDTGGAKTGEGPLVNVTYKVKCEEVPVELYETCMNHLPSPLMASGQLVGGEILSVEKLPFYVPGSWNSIYSLLRM